jgi:predicted ABC-type sugar transport system permease subunit
MQTTTLPARLRVQSILRGDSIQRLLALGALLLLLLLLAFFSAVVPHFASTNNYIDILTATAVNGVLATGVTFVIITGGIDLSVGTGMTFTSVVMGIVAVNLGLPLPLGLLAALAAGALVGSINGALIAKAKLPPFIATLGMLYVTLGMAQVISDVHPIYFDQQPAFQGFFMSKPIVGIPNIVWVMLGGAAIAWILLNKTILGRYTFALGSNEEATRLSGVNVDRWKIIIYCSRIGRPGLPAVHGRRADAPVEQRRARRLFRAVLRDDAAPDGPLDHGRLRVRGPRQPSRRRIHRRDRDRVARDRRCGPERRVEPGQGRRDGPALRRRAPVGRRRGRARPGALRPRGAGGGPCR